MRRVSLPISVFAAVVLNIAWLAESTAIVAANTGGGPCAHGNNASSTSCRNNAQGDVYGGGYAEWHNNNMYLDAAHYSAMYHINQEMWVYTRADEYQWIEIGLRNGNAVGGDPCGNCLAYEVFWADFDSNGTEYPHYIANTVPDGTNHVYEVQRQSANPNYWDVYYDFVKQGTSTVVNSSVAYEDQVGLEISRAYPGDIGPWAHSDGFHFTGLQTRALNSYSWQYWPYANTWIDQGCNVYPQGYCLNGLATPTVHDWTDNKP